MPWLWIAQLMTSEATKRKIAMKHGLDWHDVNQALVGVRGLRYTWDDHPERGRRALVEADIGGRRCIAVLYPVEDSLGDVWALGSVYPR